MNLLKYVPRSIFRVTLNLIRRQTWTPFERLLPEASRHQREWLFRRVRASQNTQFGRDHGFREIQSLKDFRQRVPVSPYSHFAPYIKAVSEGRLDALLPESDKLIQFTITTGSTGVPKLNPVTADWLREYRRGWDIWGIKLFVDHPQSIGCRVLQMAGTWDMGRTPSGHQISMVSALLARRQSLLLRPFYAIPEILNAIPDPVARHYTALRLSITDNIGWIILMNPGTLLRLAEIGNQHKDELIRDVRDGTLTRAFDIPEPIRQTLMNSRIRADVAGGQRLQEIANRTGYLLPKDYWSQPVIGCWLGGTAGFQSRNLEPVFGASPLRDMGLVSSEGRHTIPLEDGKPEGVPSVGAGFYEFVPAEEAGGPTPTALEGHELLPDRDYRLLITNSAGYFRYDLGDTVRCRGHVGEAPILEFRQKADRVADLEGEKVTEHQVVEAAHSAAQSVGVALGLVTGVPCRPPGEHPHYKFLVEISDLPESEVAQQFLQRLDNELARLNFLWRARRREGVLSEPRLLRLAPHAWEAYIAAEIQRRGTGDFQYKHPGIVADESWVDQFQPIDIIQIASRPS
jgi:hypothetical protein